jgi:gliding motility-associated-like protein
MNLTISNGASAAAINIETCGSYSLNGQTLTASGTYTDTLVAANGCDSVVTLQLSVKHQSNSSVAKTICQGENFEGYTISGTYVDTLISANGCDSIRTLQLIVVSVPAPDLGIDKALCTADTLVLDPGQYSAYLWQDGSSQNNFTVKHPGLYSVTVSNECGSAKDEIMIKEGFCDIVFPTAFTPNNDGKNDIFKALGTPNLSEYHFAVYNRWGQKLFETSELSKGWDGKFRGQLQEYGAYVWYCRYKKSNTSKASTIKGTTTLIR